MVAESKKFVVKAKPRYFNDIEYIRIADIPIDQLVRFQKWLPAAGFITVAGDDMTLHDCVHYQDYEYWIERVFKEAEEYSEF